MFRSCYLFFLLLALCLTSCDTRTTIVNNIPEREANEIVVLLASRGIDAQKVPAPVAATGGATKEPMYDINVGSSQITEAIAVLNQAGLPRVKGTSLLDLFGTQGLVPSDLQDKIRYQEGLSAQMATTIRKMDGIIDANVQITFPQEDEEKQTMTASVYVKHRGILDNPNSLTVTKIKRLVASAIPGLTPENVTVVADRALYADISLDPTGKAIPEHSWVSIWGVIVSKDSSWRFRTIFYLFLVLFFLMACALIWLFWKCYPLIMHKGPGSLFNPTPYGMNRSEEDESGPPTMEDEEEE